MFRLFVAASLGSLILALVLPAQEVKEVYYSPFDAVTIANTDAQVVQQVNDPDIQPSDMRYLRLPGKDKAARKKMKKSLDFLLNSLNTRYRTIVRTAPLPATPNPEDSETVVIRVNLHDYGIDPEAWNRLAENGSGKVPIPDPFFHTFIESVTSEEDTYEEKTVEKERTVRDQFGRVYTEKFSTTEKVKTPGKSSKNRVFAAAPWLSIEKDPALRGTTIGSLVSITQTKNPILDGRWFFTYAAWAPAYYDLIGIHTKAEKQGAVLLVKGGEKIFEELAGFDNVRSEESQVVSIADSKIVSLHNRILVRRPTVKGYTGGSYWFSIDTDKGIDDEDYMNTVATFDNPKFAAKEIIATTLNTLQIYAVADNKGNLTNFASPDIAQHGDQMPTRLQDKQIYAGIRNCSLCHKEGMIKIEDKVRDLTQGQFALFITNKLDPGKKLDRSTHKQISDKIKDAFSPDLTGLVEHDNAIHTAAIRACNNLTPRENHDNNEDLLVDYYDGYITIEKAALEAGVPPDRLEAMLKKGINLDYTLTALLSKKNSLPSRLPWERQGYAALMNFLLTQP